VTISILAFNQKEHDRIDLRDWGFPPSTAFSNLAKLQDQQTGDTIIRRGDLATLRLVGFPLAKLASTDFLF
jgi:hypothetical protein